MTWYNHSRPSWLLQIHTKPRDYCRWQRRFCGTTKRPLEIILSHAGHKQEKKIRIQLATISKDEGGTKWWKSPARSLMTAWHGMMLKHPKLSIIEAEIMKSQPKDSPELSIALCSLCAFFVSFVIPSSL